MIHKFSYTTESGYILNDSKVALDVTAIRQLLSDVFKLSAFEVNAFLDNIESKKELTLEEKEGSKGVIVDLYEVEYPAPADPEKETQELARHLDERKDFITQYLFPGTTTEEVQVGVKPPDQAADDVKVQPASSVKASLNWRDILK